MRIGDTFLGPLPQQPHLWIVITTPNDRGEVAIVNFTSTICDKTCQVAPGEHPFVKKPTVVRYQDARLALVSDLRKGCERGLLSLRTPVDSNLLRRIQQGALQSPFTPGKVAREVKRALELQV
ncbi:hypothetical protein FJY63_08295 [Candidatus Sumerlaeota bacterium]|nr:hypothetical protein [Candidatus Sumerlaeota bacterium]